MMMPSPSIPLPWERDFTPLLPWEKGLGDEGNTRKSTRLCPLPKSLSPGRGTSPLLPWEKGLGDEGNTPKFKVGKNVSTN